VTAGARLGNEIREGLQPPSLTSSIIAFTTLSMKTLQGILSMHAYIASENFGQTLKYGQGWL